MVLPERGVVALFPVNVLCFRVDSVLEAAGWASTPPSEYLHLPSGSGPAPWLGTAVLFQFHVLVTFLF